MLLNEIRVSREAIVKSQANSRRSDKGFPVIFTGFNTQNCVILFFVFTVNKHVKT